MRVSVAPSQTAAVSRRIFMHNLTLSRRGLFGGAAGAAALVAFGAPRLSFAQTAPVAAPTFYDRRVGDVTITTLLDGYIPLGLDAMVGIDAATAAADLTAAYLPPAGPVPTPINAYLIRSGDQTTLIDAGAAGAFGPTTGRLAATLEAMGVAPASINRIVLTHMHADHIAGLMAGEAAAFPNASVHVSQTDLAFWTDETIAASAPESAQIFFTLARTVAAAYGERVMPFDGDNVDLGGGLTSIAMPGHTPGHTGFRLSSGTDQLIIWGDIAHMRALQFARPDVGISFDTDGALAIQTRKRIMAMMAADKIAVTGSHLPFPAAGHVEVKGDAFAWVPEEWQFL
jgi:glyoxylase-like metal-dependent hydrolase (beta-lactamase superfamily II)